ncbi:MAG: N-acetylmuramic acid 6-phosphate etherase [Vulcanimicrobiaceae bacterium]
MSESVVPTEARNPRTTHLDSLATNDLVLLLASEASRAVHTVVGATTSLCQAVDVIVAALAGGGRLHYVGAGTSGRLGVLDAAEIPPTFGANENVFCAHIAGGTPALRRAVEGAEDDGIAGENEMRNCVHSGDVVLGISASGGAEFVVSAVRAAKELGATSLAMCNVATSPLASAADIVILLETGPEPIAGSTRMLAGAAQKVALATLSTAVMVRLGYVHENLMVGVLPTNAKLRKRARRLVEMLANVDGALAETLLESSGSVKVAVLMHRLSMDSVSAEKHLADHGGNLRSALAVPQR